MWNRAFRRPLARKASLIAGMVLGGLGGLALKEPSHHEDSPDYELVQVQLVTRHGVRAPQTMPEKYKEFDWQCNPRHDHRLEIHKQDNIHNFEEYKLTFDNLQTKVLGSCGLAQLTVKGDLQSETLGRLLRKRYIDGLQAMKENFDSDDYYIRSTDTSRTIWTARQMWKGLYPDSSRAEEDVLKIKVLPNEEENMYPRTCAKITQLQREINNREETIHRKKVTKNHFSEEHLGEDELKYWNTRTTMGICNNLSSFHMNKLPLPKGISEKEVKTICEMSGKFYNDKYSDDTISRLGIGRFLADMKEHVDEAISSKSRTKPFFIHYSGHDNTLGPLINSLTIGNKQHPAMGSAIILEIWRQKQTDKKFFQFYFYDEETFVPLKMESCASSFCEVSKLTNRMEELIPHPEEYERECKGLNSTAINK